MTDLEMTRLCAEAMGLTPPTAEQNTTGGTWIEGTWYDPLHDDAQAMALVKRFRLSTRCYPDDVDGPEWRCYERIDSFVGSAYDLNRAIVECVAKMRAALSDKHSEDR